MKNFYLIAACLIALLFSYESMSQIGQDGRTGYYDNLEPNEESEITVKADLVNEGTVRTDTLDAATGSLLSILADTEYTSTGYVLLPKGTIAERPGTPLAGMFRYNTDEETFEGYTDEWGPIAGGGGAQPFEPLEEYEENDSVVANDKLWYANAAFVAGATFDPADWTLISPLRLEDGVTKVDRGGTLYEAGSRNPEYVELINDPSFQAGVSEWSCTNATVEQVSNASASNIDHGVDRSATSAKITVTADGGYCEIVKTIGTSQAGTYVPSIYYASSSADAFIEFARDSRARVVDELDFINSGDYEFLSAQILASTGLSVRLGGNNTDVIHADMASFELGGYNRSASKNCSGVLDCENMHIGFYDASASSVLEQKPETFITSVVKSGNSNVEKEFTVPSGVFAQSPNCVATGAGELASGVSSTGTKVDYRKDLSSATSLFFTTRNNSGTSDDLDFTFHCTKSGTDYKTTEDQGVTLIPDNKDALFQAYTESGQTVGNDTVSIEFTDAQVADSEYFSWDDTTHELTVIKSGLYSLDSSIQIATASGTVSHVPTSYFERNEGAGYVKIGFTERSTLLNGNSTSSTNKRIYDLTPSGAVRLNKNDKIRLRMFGDNASTDSRGPSYISITPLGGGKAVVENQGVPTYEGEGGMIAGYASFGGATDGSVCSTSSCVKYRESKGLGEVMSVNPNSTGDYDLDMSGFKPNSFITCSGSASNASGTSRQVGFSVQSFAVDGNGDASVNLRTDNNAGVLEDTYFQVKCEGPRP